MPRDKRINLDFGLESVVFVISVCAVPCRATFWLGMCTATVESSVSPSEGVGRCRFSPEVCIVFDAGSPWGAAVDGRGAHGDVRGHHGGDEVSRRGARAPVCNIPTRVLALRVEM